MVALLCLWRAGKLPWLPCATDTNLYERSRDDDERLPLSADRKQRARQSGRRSDRFSGTSTRDSRGEGGGGGGRALAASRSRLASSLSSMRRSHISLRVIAPKAAAPAATPSSAYAQREWL